MKIQLSLILLMLIVPLVHSQDIVILGCQGEILKEELKLDTSKPDEKIKSSRKVLTEIFVDKKNRIIRVQDTTLDFCKEIKDCTCLFDENNYQCKRIRKLKGDFYESNDETSISIGRKTGITNYFFFNQSISKFSDKQISNTDVLRGQFQCEINDKNKF